MAFQNPAELQNSASIWCYFWDLNGNVSNFMQLISMHAAHLWLQPKRRAGKVEKIVKLKPTQTLAFESLDD